MKIFKVILNILIVVIAFLWLNLSSVSLTIFSPIKFDLSKLYNGKEVIEMAVSERNNAIHVLNNQNYAIGVIGLLLISMLVIVNIVMVIKGNKTQ